MMDHKEVSWNGGKIMGEVVPDDIDGDSSIPKGREFVPTPQQVAVLERMFDARHGFGKESHLAHGVSDIPIVAELRAENAILRKALERIKNVLANQGSLHEFCFNVANCALDGKEYMKHRGGSDR